MRKDSFAFEKSNNAKYSKAYASYFAAYLLAHLRSSSVISQIILFGSIAKGEATTQSDLDLFIEVKKESKAIIREIEAITKQFYKGREALLFKAKGIEHKINAVVGKLDDWKDLKKSIESTGVILYGRYVPQGVEGRKYNLFFWDSVGKNRGAFLNKLYGFTVRGKRYSGALEKLGGRKIGKSCVLIPIEHSEEILNLCKYHKANIKIMEVYA